MQDDREYEVSASASGRQHMSAVMSTYLTIVVKGERKMRGERRKRRRREEERGGGKGGESYLFHVYYDLDFISTSFITLHDLKIY